MKKLIALLALMSGTGAFAVDLTVKNKTEDRFDVTMLYTSKGEKEERPFYFGSLAAGQTKKTDATQQAHGVDCITEITVQGAGSNKTKSIQGNRACSPSHEWTITYKKRILGLGKRLVIEHKSE